VLIGCAVVVVAAAAAAPVVVMASVVAPNPAVCFHAVCFVRAMVGWLVGLTAQQAGRGEGKEEGEEEANTPLLEQGEEE
jgi:hypothetical protein